MSKKWVLIPLLLVILLAAGSHFAFQSGYFSEKARLFSKKHIEMLLDKRVEIRSARVNLFSASVLLDGISIEIRESETPSKLLAEQIQISFSPWSLFMEAFMVREVAIDSPVLILNEEAMKEMALAFHPSGLEDKRGTAKVVVRSILVQNGSVSYSGLEGVQSFSMDKVNLKVDPNLKMDEFDVEFSGSGGGFKIDAGDGHLDVLEVKMRIHPDKIGLEKAWLSSHQGTLLAEGIFTFGREDPLDFQFDAQMPLANLDFLRPGESEEEILRGKNLSGKAVLLGQLSGSPSSPNMKGRMVLSPVHLEGQEIGMFGADLAYEKGLLHVDSVSGEIFSGTFSGSGKAQFPSSPNLVDGAGRSSNFRFNIKYQDLSLHQVVQNLGVFDVENDGLFSGIFLGGDVIFSGDDSNLKNVSLAGRLNAIRRPLFSPALPEKAKRFPRVMALLSKGEVDWLWSGGGLFLNKGKVYFPETEVDFSGEWNQDAGLSIATIVSSEEMEALAASLRMPVTGRLKLDGVLGGRINHPTFNGDILLEKWTLRAQSFGTFSSHLSYATRRVTFKQGRLMAPFSPPISNLARKVKNNLPRYQFEGDINFEDFSHPLFDLRVDAQSADPLEILTLFKRPIPLQTRATGRLLIQGTPKALKVHGGLVLSKGVLYGESFERGKLALTVTEKEVRFRDVVIEKNRSRLIGEGEVGYRGSYRIALRGRRLKIQKSGFFQSHLPFLAGEIGLKLSGKGSFKQPGLNVKVEISDLHYGELDGGGGSLSIQWNDRLVKVDGRLPDQHFSLEGEVLLTETYPFSFKSHFDTLQLAPFFKAHLTGLVSNIGIQLSGNMAGKGTFSQLDKVNLDGSFSKMAADFNGYTIHNDGTIKVHSVNGKFFIKDNRFKGENTSLAFNGSMALLKSWDLLMEGEADLNLITFFTKEISSGSGNAKLNLRVSDHWERPHINGVLQLKNGKIRAERLARTALIDSMEIIFNQDHLVLEAFEGKIGGGRFHGSGKGVISGLALESFGFLLTLEDAGVKILPKLIAKVDGDLFFKRDSERQSLKGELKIKKAVYEARTDIKSFMAKLNKNKGQALWSNGLISGKTEFNVHLYGREGVWINNNLAKIPLSVDVFLRGSNEKPLLVGRVDLPRGKIFLRRNHFRVVSGSVDFLDPEKIDPTFDINAKADVRNYATDQTYKVELSLRGSLSQITLSLSSSPVLPEADVLALLTLGKTTADIVDGGSGGEATAFVVSELLEEPVQKVTGVDRIQVNPTVGESNGTKSSKGTRVTAEKRLLEDRLIVVYSTTLDPSEEDLIRMVYEVNKNISLVGNRDDRGQMGGDIRFRFEFR